MTNSMMTPSAIPRPMVRWPAAAWQALYEHWREYLMEAAGLGIFMISAGVFFTLLDTPGAYLNPYLPDPFVRLALGGAAMGLTAIGIIYSPWGQQSGAHINPAVTLCFLRLGKIAPWDAVFYVLAQFAGGLAGVLLVFGLFGPSFAEPPVRFVVTVPGVRGPLVAFAAEIAIAFGLMTMVLWTSNSARRSRFTGLFAGLLVATYITFEAPLSGMSMNPARTVASALPAGVWTAGWIYFLAPLLGMLGAAELYCLLQGKVFCAKLNHHTERRCIFRCGYHVEEEGTARGA